MTAELPSRVRRPRGAAESLATIVLGFESLVAVLADKDAAGIVSALQPLATHVFATAPESERANDADRIADLAELAGLPVTVHGDVGDATAAAREWAAASDRRAVVIAGSVLLAGEALTRAAAEDWKSGWQE